jgi:plastocyanin
VGTTRMDARTRSHRGKAAVFAVLLGAAMTAALLVPSAGSATSGVTGCDTGTPAGPNSTTYECNIPTGTIGGYEVRQWMQFGIPVPPENGFITHMETDIVDEGTGAQVPISRLMLHHIVFINLNRQDATCAGQGYLGFDNRKDFGNIAPQRFYAAGEERAKMSMPPGYGYPTTQTDQWGVVAMVMNHRSAVDHALIHYEVTVNDGQGAPVAPVKPYWFDVRDCRADPIYNIPSVAQKAKKAKKEKKGRKADAAAAKKHKKGKKKGKKRKKAAARPTTDETRDYTFPESGRLIAGAGHVHGGAIKETLTEPSCDNRQVAESDPTWGLPDHPFYNVRPILHEPGPINMSAFRSTTGLPIHAGETLRLNSIYDDSQPHVRVMGIMVVYLAPDPSVKENCGPVPNWETFKTDQPGRSGPIPFTIPLTGLDANGQATTIKAPPGTIQNAGRNTVIPVGDRYFGAPNLRVRKGSFLTWQFNGKELHNVTLANGPLGIGTDNLDGGRTFTEKLNRPGTYRFFCALHPVQMQERVIVTAKKKNKKKR